jgi:hypothetical protein
MVTHKTNDGPPNRQLATVNLDLAVSDRIGGVSWLAALPVNHFAPQARAT